MHTNKTIQACIPHNKYHSVHDLTFELRRPILEQGTNLALQPHQVLSHHKLNRRLCGQSCNHFGSSNSVAARDEVNEAYLKLEGEAGHARLRTGVESERWLC